METTKAVSALSALAQETRLAIFRLLVQAGPEGLSAGAIAERLAASPATLSFHLKELAKAGLVSSRPSARFIFYSANYEGMAELMAYLTRHCCRGMPVECLSTVEIALAGCCTPASERKSP